MRRSGTTAIRAASIALAITNAACVGEIGDPGRTDSFRGGTPEGGEHGTSSPPTTRIRRLTKLEIEATVAAVFGEAAAAYTSELEGDTRIFGFSTGDERTITPSYVEKLHGVAEAIAAAFRATIGDQGFEPACFASDDGGRACAAVLIGRVGERAFRRPLDDDEVERLLAVYDAGRETGSPDDPGDRFAAGLAWTVEAIIQSPHFIFRTEMGDAAVASGDVTRLTQDEIASALSYSLLAAPPDDALIAAARGGALSSPEAIGAEARRLLQTHTDAFKKSAHRFVQEWLRVDLDKPEWGKDTALYPSFSPQTIEALRAEMRAFDDHWIDEGASLDFLLTTNEGFVSPSTAWIYGVPAPSGMELVSFDPAERAGVLTQAGFLGSQAHTDNGSPVYRGLAVRRGLLCMEPPPVPNDVPPLPAQKETTAKTNRERYEQHVSSSTCASCHSQMDPMGFPFESYDGIGAYRTTDNGYPVDTSGAIVGSEDSDRDVENAIELVMTLAQSEHVHACFARQIFRYAIGRREDAYDDPTLEEAARALASASMDVREIYVAVAASDSFVLRTVAKEP